MNVKDIIEAIRASELKGNTPFHFVSVPKDGQGAVVEYGRSSCLEDEIYMLSLHIEAVRTIYVRNGKLLGYSNGANFNDREQWMDFLHILYLCTVADKEYDDLFNTDSTQTSVMRIPKSGGGNEQ